MFLRPFHPHRFLRSVYGTEVFAEYCRQRAIPFEQRSAPPASNEDMERWTAALADLPSELHAHIELELATVNEMAGRDSIAHLIEAAGSDDLPPQNVPTGAPLALWYFLHRSSLFHEVFLEHEIEEVDSWRTGQAPSGIVFPDLDATERALRATLQEFFRVQRTGQFCMVEGYQLSEVTCFVAQVADRLQFLETFTDSGQPTRQRLRPAITVLMVYYPSDGTVLLKSHLRAQDRTAELFRRFGEAVIGGPVTCSDAAFNLDVLKQPFRPLPDAEDMELIRVKALHLRYPQSEGRRQVKLETLIRDEPSAIDRLLRTHVSDQDLPLLRVCHAELHVRLRSHGRSRNYLIRLWRNRSNLGQSDLGERLRSCLQRWGLSHAR